MNQHSRKNENNLLQYTGQDPNGMLQDQLDRFIKHVAQAPISFSETFYLSKQLKETGKLNKAHITLNNLKCIRYVSRNQALPDILVKALIQFFVHENVSEGSSYFSYNPHLLIAQILKYSVRQNSSCIDQSQFPALLEKCKASNLDEGNSLAKAILNEIVLAIVFSLDKTPIPHSKEPQIVLHYLQNSSLLPYVNSSLRAKIKLLELDATKITKQFSNDNYKEKNNCNKPEQYEGANFGFGNKILKDVGSDLKGSKPASFQSHVIKSQQSVISNYKEFHSERSSLQQVGFVNALGSMTNKLSTQETHDELRFLNSAGKSIRGYLYTYTETFFDIAKKNLELSDEDKVIFCDDDIDWLCTKFYLRPYESPTSKLESINKIAATFAMISEYTKLSRNQLKPFVKQMFEQYLDKEWNLSRRFILIVIDNQSTRHKSILDQDSLKILEKFAYDCDPQVYATIWLVLFKTMGDSQYNKSFPRNMDALCKIITNGPGDENRKRAISFLRKDVCSTYRCKLISGMCAEPFVVSLLTFVMNSQPDSDLQLRIQVAEILENYMAHSFTHAIHSERVKQILECVISMSESDSVVDAKENQEGGQNPIDNFYQDILNRYTQRALSTESKATANSSTNKISSLRFCLIRIIVYSISKQIHANEHTCSNHVIENLILLCTMEFLSADLRILIINAIENWSCSNPTIYLPNACLLSSRLLDQDMIYPDGSIFHGNSHSKLNQNSDSTLEFCYVSANVAKLLIRQTNLKQMSNECQSIIQMAFEGLKSHPDKTTQILCSQLIFASLVNNEGILPFSKTDLEDIRQMCCGSEIIDIKVYCTSAYCLSMRYLVRSFASASNSASDPEAFLRIESYEVDALAEMYAWEELRLEGEDHQKYINSSIIDIVGILAADLNNEFSQDVCQLLASILEHSCVETVREVLTILRSYTKQREGKERVVSLPINCILAIEKSFTLNDPQILELCDEIFLNLLLNGQRLSEFVLAELMKRFISLCPDETDEYVKLIKLLYLANENQDVPDFLFRQLDMELTGMKIMSCFKTQVWTNSSFLELLNFFNAHGQGSSIVKGSSFEDQEYYFDQLNSFVDKGMFISPFNSKVIPQCLALGLFGHQVLKLLKTAVENGQHIPPQIITQAFQTFLNDQEGQVFQMRFETIANLAIALLEKNQSLPADFIQFVSNAFMDKNAAQNLRDLWLRVLGKIVGNLNYLERSVVECICGYFFESVKSRLEILNILICLIRSGSMYKDKDCFIIFQKVFIASIQNDETFLIVNEKEISIRGLKLLQEQSKVCFSSEEIKVLDSCISNNTKTSLSVSVAAKELVKQMLLQSKEIKIKTFTKLNDKDDLELVGSLSEYKSLPPSHYWLERVKRILKNRNLPKEENGVLITALEVVTRLDEMPTDVIDLVGDIFLSSSDYCVRNAASSLLENVILERKITVISAHLFENLICTRKSCTKIDSVLNLVYENGLAPIISEVTKSDLNNSEKELINFFAKLQADGEPLDLVKYNAEYLSQRLDKCISENCEMSTEFLSILFSLDPVILKSVPKIDIFLSRLFLNQFSSIKEFDLSSSVEIIEESVLTFNSLFDVNNNENNGLVLKDISNISPVYKAYTLILKDRLYSSNRDFTSVVSSLIQVLASITDLNSPLPDEKSNTKIVMRILNCFGPLVSDLNVTIPSILIEIFENYLHHVVPEIRILAFEILRQLPEYSMDFMIDNVYLEIYGDDISSKKGDLEFNLDLLKLLLSIEFWDLKSLEALDKNEWSKNLLIANYIATYACDNSTRNKLKEQLLRLFYVFTHEGAIQILQQMTMDTFKSKQVSISEILQLLDSICEMKFEKVFSLMAQDTNDKHWFEKILHSATLSLFSTIFANPIHPDILNSYTNKLIGLVGEYSARPLLKTISVIKTDGEFKELLKVLKYFPNKDCISEQIQLLQAKVGKDPNLKNCECVTHLLKLGHLLTFWPIDFANREKVILYLDKCLSQQFEIEKIVKLFHLLDITKESTLSQNGFSFMEKNYKILNILYQVYNYAASKFDFDNIIVGLENWANKRNDDKNNPKLLKKENEQNPTALVHGILMSSKFQDGTGRKHLEQILNDFLSINKQAENSNSNFTSKLKENIEMILEGTKTVLLIKQEQEFPVCQWNVQNIKSWSEEQKSNPNCLQYDQFILEFLMIARRAYFLWKGYNLTYVQILSCLMALGEDENDEGKKRQLQQVVTGCGKSTIIALVAIAKALRGNNVDVYTSSPVLAERDTREWSPFFKMFGLSCDHNGDRGQEYFSGPKSCYKENIVYGDTSQFQFDTLRDEYSALETRGGRKFDFALIDEVDCMLIDDSSKLARLSATLPAMDSIQILYHFIWERLLFLQKHLISVQGNIFYVEGQIIVSNGKLVYTFAQKGTDKLFEIEDLLAFISTASDLEEAQIYVVTDINEFMITNLTTYAENLVSTSDKMNENDKMEKIQIPRNVMEFVKARVPKWVESALHALIYEENVNYIVDDGQIKPVDYETTGVVQSSTNWSHGLHQFLQLKHSLKIISESVTTNFLSNIAMFEKYGKNLVGLTGTLGSEVGREILSHAEVYDAQLYLIPENHFKCFYRLPHIFMNDIQLWLEEIVYAALHECFKNRGVLIIMKTISEAHEISSMLEKHRISVKLYTRNDANQEHIVERVLPRDVIVSTNLAGRGTDIQAADIEEFGGLHVILTFLPDSLRVEEQAFGRTSRQGQNGTSQIIAFTPSYTKMTDDDSESILRIRNDFEEIRMKKFQESLQVVKSKDKVFSKFCLFFNRVRSQLRDKLHKSSFTLKKSSLAHPLESIVLKSLEELWAMFLNKVDDGRINISEIGEEYISFERNAWEQVDKILCSTDILNTGVELLPCESAFYWIQLGNHEFASDSKFKYSLDKSKMYYDKAMEFDPKFAAAAYVGKAYALLKGRVNLVMATHYEKEYKEKSIKLLDHGLRLLAEEMSTLTTMQTFLLNRNEADGNSEECDLHQQLVAKMNILGSYIQSVEENKKIVEKSLRSLYYEEYSDEGIKHGLVDDNFFSKPSKPGAIYNLSFHDLTTMQDMGDNDQVVETIDDTAQYIKNVSLSFSYTDEEFPLKDISWSCDPFKDLLLRFEYSNLTLVEVQNTVIGLAALGIQGFFTLFPTVFQNEMWEIFPKTNVKSEEILETLTAYKSQHPSGTLSFKLIFSGVNPTKFIEREGVNWKALSNLNPDEWRMEIYNFENVRAAQKAAHVCRKSNIDFVLKFSSLTWNDAQIVFLSASKGQENIQVFKANSLLDTYRNSPSLIDLVEFQSRGISFLVVFKERNFIPWKTVTSIGILAGVQATVGICLFCTGVGASVGLGLVAESAADLATSLSLISTRDFSWKEYAIQKSVSLAISASFAGSLMFTGGAAGLGGRRIAQKGIAKIASKSSSTAITHAKIGLHVVEAALQSALRSRDLWSSSMMNYNTLAQSSKGQVESSVPPSIFNERSSQFSFNLHQDQIEKHFEKLWEEKTKELNGVLSRHYALDKVFKTRSLKAKVEQFIRRITNSEVDVWANIWQQIASVLAHNAITNLQTDKLFKADLHDMGLETIGNVIERISKELVNKLKSKEEIIRASPQSIIQNICQISVTKAKECARFVIIANADGSDFSVDNYVIDELTALVGEDKFFELKECFTNLHEFQSSLKTSDSGELKILNTFIVRSITDHIIKVANNELMNSKRAPKVGSLISQFNPDYESVLKKLSYGTNTQSMKTSESVFDENNKIGSVEPITSESNTISVEIFLDPNISIRGSVVKAQHHLLFRRNSKGTNTAEP